MESVIFNTHDVILLMTAYQCVLFAILLFTRRERRLTNILLALFLIQHAAIPLDILIQFGAEFRFIALEWSPNLFYVFGFGYWLEGPLLLWYTRSLVYKNYTLTRRDIWYLLPAICFLIYQIFFYYALDFDEKKSMQEHYDLFVAPAYMNYVTIFRDLFRFALGVMCLVELRRFSRHLQHNYSDIEKLELNWLRLLVIGFLAIRGWSVLVVFLVMLAVIFGVETNFEIMGLTGNYTTFVLVSLLIFYSLGHAHLAEGLESHSAEADARADETTREKFKPEQIQALTQLMEEEKPYLQPALTLEKLAAQLQVPARSLSSMINRQFSCNFFEFINAYRINEAKRLLSAPESAQKTMLDIMYEVGFNSKATFNTLFKKKVGMTPSEYRRLAVHEENS
jgi:AraC-like DNA-binding protein